MGYDEYQIFRSNQLYDGISIPRMMLLKENVDLRKYKTEAILAMHTT